MGCFVFERREVRILIFRLEEVWLWKMEVLLLLGELFLQLVGQEEEMVVKYFVLYRLFEVVVKQVVEEESGSQVKKEALNGQENN